MTTAVGASGNARSDCAETCEASASHACHHASVAWSYTPPPTPWMKTSHAAARSSAVMSSARGASCSRGTLAKSCAKTGVRGMLLRTRQRGSSIRVSVTTSGRNRAAGTPAIALLYRSAHSRGACCMSDNAASNIAVPASAVAQHCVSIGARPWSGSKAAALNWVANVDASA